MAQKATNGEQNYVRLLLLIVEEGTEGVRNVYRSLLDDKGTPFVDALKAAKRKLTQFKKNGDLYKDQYDRLFPKQGTPNVNKLDITLLVFLLRNKIGVDTPSTVWTNPNPPDKDISKFADVMRIKTMRNNLAHSPSAKLTNKEYQDNLRTLEFPLERLGISKAKIKKCLTKSIGVADLKIITAIQELEENRRKDLTDYINEKIDKLRQHDPDSYLHNNHTCRNLGNEFVVEILYYGKLVAKQHIEHENGGSSVGIMYGNLKRRATEKDGEAMANKVFGSYGALLQIPSPKDECLSQDKIGPLTDLCNNFSRGIIIYSNDGRLSVERNCRVSPYYVSVKTKDACKIMRDEPSPHQIFSYDADFLPRVKNEPEQADPAVYIVMGKTVNYDNRNDPELAMTIRVAACKALDTLSLTTPYTEDSCDYQMSNETSGDLYTRKLVEGHENADNYAAQDGANAVPATEPEVPAKKRRNRKRPKRRADEVNKDIAETFVASPSGSALAPVLPSGSRVHSSVFVVNDELQMDTS